MAKFDTDFDILIGKLSFAYRQFCLSEIIHAKVKTKYYRKFLRVWNTILFSLELGYLLELAKIFEQPDRKVEETLSIYYFLDYEFKDHYRTIKKLQKFRNKVLAHIDLRVARDPKRFMKKEVALNQHQVWLLFEKTIEVVDKVKLHFGLTEDLSRRFQEEKSLIQQEFQNFVPAKYL